MHRRIQWIAAIGLAAWCIGGAYADFTKDSRVTYTNWGQDDQQLSMWLPEDSGAGLRPAMVLVHGGGWLMGSRMQIRTYGEEFAKAGYVTASISYRTMPDYAFPYCLHDVKQAIRFLRENAAAYRIDPDRIIVFGESAGGHLAGLAAVTQPKDGFEGPNASETSTAVQAAVLFYGAVDLTLWKPNGTEKGAKKGLSRFMTDFVSREYPDVADPFAHASPVTYADPNDPPTLLIHGTADSMVDIKQSQNFRDALQAKNVIADFIEVDGAGHGFDHFSPRTRREIIDLILKWLDDRGFGSETN